MDAVLPMPALPVEAAPRTWAVDGALIPAYLAWIGRTTQDHALRGHLALSSFAGFYQSHEMPIAGSEFWRQQYGYYDAAAQAVHAVHAAARFIVSPYWSVNRKGNNFTLAESAAGAAALASTAIDVLAPQEGRGTGKAGCFWEHEADLLIADVDPNLARYPNVDANATFRQQFWASTHELYAAARIAVDNANGRRANEDLQLELWFNLEAFEHTKLNVCGGATGTCDRTNKSRVDRSLAYAAGSVDRVLSFMWDPFYTCAPHGYTGSLAHGITADSDRPILVSVDMDVAKRTAALGGYGICAAGATVFVRWAPEATAHMVTSSAPITACHRAGAAASSALQVGTIALPFTEAPPHGTFVGFLASAAGKNASLEFAVGMK